MDVETQGSISLLSNKEKLSLKVKGSGTIVVRIGSENKNYELNETDETIIEHTFGDQREVEIQNAKIISEMNVAENGISSIILNGCSKLNKLLIYNNEIRNLDLSQAAEIQYIHMQNNPICKDKAAMEAMISTLPDRNYKAFGSIVMYDFIPLNNALNEEQSSIRNLRKELEKTSIPKDWYFGSAILYHPSEKNKVSNTAIMSNVVDIWESAEYGEGAVYASLYEMYVPDQTSEWTKEQFYAKYDITATGQVVESTQTDSNASYDTGHGTSTNSILISQGNEMYGLIPKSKCVAIMRGNNTNIDYYISPNVFNKLTELERLDFVFTSTTWTTDSERNYEAYEQSIRKCLDRHKTLFFICSMNSGDDDISTKDPYVNTYHAHMVSGCNLDIDASNIETYISAPSNGDSRIKFTGNYIGINTLRKTGGINVGGFGTSNATPFQAGIFCLLKILYDKKKREYTLEELEQYTYNHARPLHYNEDKVSGYGTLDCMYFRDVTKDIKVKTIVKKEELLDLSKNDMINSAIGIIPPEATNQDFRLANKLDDRDIIIDKGVIYPQRNDGRTVNKKLYSSGNLELSETINIKLPTNKKYEEVKSDLIFSFSGSNENLTEDITGKPLRKTGKIIQKDKKVKFDSNGALIWDDFKMPRKITIQFCTDKEDTVTSTEYPVYLYNSKNNKEKIVCALQLAKVENEQKVRNIFQLGTSIGNVLANFGSNHTGKYNEPFNVYTLIIDFDNGKIIFYRNGISILAYQISDVKSYISSTSPTKTAYRENLRNLLNIDTIVIGNSGSLTKGSVNSEIYDIRIFDRVLTPTEVVKNTSALMCNAQYKGGENMDYKGSVSLISGLTQANGGKFPLVDGAAVQFGNEENKDGTYKSVVQKIQELEMGAGNEVITEDEINGLF